MSAPAPGLYWAETGAVLPLRYQVEVLADGSCIACGITWTPLLAQQMHADGRLHPGPIPTFAQNPRP
jgi:hypothetical protein